MAVAREGSVDLRRFSVYRPFTEVPIIEKCRADNWYMPIIGRLRYNAREIYSLSTSADRTKINHGHAHKINSIDCACARGVCALQSSSFYVYYSNNIIIFLKFKFDHDCSYRSSVMAFFSFH